MMALTALEDFAQIIADESTVERKSSITSATSTRTMRQGELLTELGNAGSVVLSLKAKESSGSIITLSIKKVYMALTARESLPGTKNRLKILMIRFDNMARRLTENMRMVRLHPIGLESIYQKARWRR